jgi:hypothetical protein
VTSSLEDRGEPDLGACYCDIVDGLGVDLRGDLVTNDFGP